MIRSTAESELSLEEGVRFTTTVAPSTKHEPIPEEWKKYLKYDVEVDQSQDDKSKEIMICSFGRPHMRCFHCTWWAFFIAFFIWYSMPPLLGYIKQDLHLSKSDIWTSNIVAVGSTIVVRFIVGPLCDVYGPRVLFSIMLCSSAIFTACTGLVHNMQSLCVIRGLIGIAGGTFVTTEYWTSRMFTKEVVGTANGLVAGWGNLGAGVANLVVGSALMPLFQTMTGSTQTAWRTVCIVPAFIAFVTGIVIYFISDDSPKGNYWELKNRGQFRAVKPIPSFTKASLDLNTWILSVQYACCFGVELTMYSAASLYFQDKFGQSKKVADAMINIFGWLNLFVRGLGGFLSDACFYKYGMKGRIWIETIMLVCEGCMVFFLRTSDTLTSAMVTLVIFAVFVGMSKGTSFGIVPYIDPGNMGAVMGIIGAGGNVGAMCFSLAFQSLTYDQAFTIMGSTILGSAFLSLFLVINGYSGIVWGKDQNVDRETGHLLPKERSTEQPLDDDS